MVVVQSTDEADLLFIGDLAFTESGISKKAPVTGMHFDIPSIRNLHRIIRELKKNDPSIIIIPSHSRTIMEVLSK
jgi:glyoxylase-like metal-dependent hydrolase (beta-lactamase superfamily II)